MGRENKNKEVANLHKQRILEASETLFSEKGFAESKIEDIAEKAGYSRRTIYAYFFGKDDILHCIIAKGLQKLKADIEGILKEGGGYYAVFYRIFEAMESYVESCPQSAENVMQAKSEKLIVAKSPAVQKILTLGTEINELLIDFVERGKQLGTVRAEVIPAFSVFVLWSEVTALLELVKSKGAFFEKSFSVSKKEFLKYGYRQILNGILK